MENVTESIEAIAELMGYVKTSSDKDFTFYEHPDGKGIIIQSDYDYKKFISHGLMESRGFAFNRDWRWLMPVVEKIESLGVSVEIKGEYSVFQKKVYHSVTINWEKYKHIDGTCATGEYCVFDYSANRCNKLEAVFEAVAKFAKWYKTQK